jgi:hypothetical protein
LFVEIVFVGVVGVEAGVEVVVDVDGGGQGGLVDGNY